MDDVVLLDGGSGHELKRRGVAEVPGWEGFFIGGALANVRQPELVRQLHADYLAAGADVLTTNSFVVTPWHLRRALGPHDAAGCSLEELTRAAAERAAEAVEAAPARRCGARPRVAGCLPPLSECYGGEGAPQAPSSPSPAARAEALHTYSRIAAALAPRCDLLLCETAAAPDDAAAAVSAAAATGLPVWVSFTVTDEPTSSSSSAPRLRGGALLADALADVARAGRVSTWLLNCSAPAAVQAALPALAAAAPPGVPIGAYPNAFRRSTSEWLAASAAVEPSAPPLLPGSAGAAAAAATPPSDARCCEAVAADEMDASVLSPAEFADVVVRWAGRDAEARCMVLGGCCGTGPGHIAALAAALGRSGSSSSS